MDLLDEVDGTLACRLRTRLTAVADLQRSLLTDPDDPFLTEAALHLVAAGGKRIRPLLVLLGAEFGEKHGSEAVHRAAVMVELVHVGSLYRDDVIDQADVRRGVPTGHSMWGDWTALLVGGYLLAVAAEIGAGLGSEVMRRTARTLTSLVRGQLREARGPRAGEDPVAHYRDVIRDKSASLVATAVWLGAEVANAPTPVTSALTAYGEELGTAFQISDDLLDIVSTAGVSGKTPGTDLRQGVATLPLLYALSTESEDTSRLRQLVAGPVPEGPALDEALRLLRASSGTTRARSDVRRHAGLARARLEPLPDGPTLWALTRLCDIMTERVSRSPRESA